MQNYFLPCSSSYEELYHPQEPRYVPLKAYSHEAFCNYP